MTEILILDRYRRSQKQALEELRRGFVLELLFGEDEGKLEVESEMLKIDIKRPKILTVLEIDAKPGESEERREMIENTVSKNPEGNGEDEQSYIGQGRRAHHQCV